MKRTFSLVAVMTCVLVSPVVAHSTAPPASAEQELRSLVQEIDAALKNRDRSMLEHCIAGDFAILHSTGKLEGRQSYIDRAAAGSLMSQRVPAEVEEEAMRVYDNRTALRTTRIKAILHHADQPPEEMSLRSIDVYVKIDGRWLWVSEQSTPIPSGAGPPAK